MAVDSTTSSGKKRKLSRQFRLLAKQQKLFDELLTKNHQLSDQLLVKQNQLLDELLSRHHHLVDELAVKQHTFNLLLLKQCKLIFASAGAAAPATVPAATPAEGNVDALVQELLAEGGTNRWDVEDEADSSLAPATVAKPAVLEKKPAQEKPTPAKPKPKPKKGDDDDEPRVATKYWITLASLGAILVLYLGVSYWNSPLSEKALVQRALSASTTEERVHAANELRARQANSDLRRVAAESKDAEVLLLVINYLWGASDGASAPVFYTAMKHEDKGVREAGLKGAQKLYGEVLPGKIDYQVDDPPEQREQAVTKLLDFYKNPPRMPMSH